MASSNRHWPSMFKSKPSSSHHQRQYHDHTTPLPGYHRAHPYSQVGTGMEERTPEPKPRWNPRPEQIRILEAIFNSGLVNPPRDEIRRIRAQLQEYGQVGDANVFYWFQNRKSRTKHKQRQLQNAAGKSHARHTTAATSSSSSSASGKSSPNNNSNEKKPITTDSPAPSVNQPPFLPPPTGFSPEPFFNFAGNLAPGFLFPDIPSDVVDHSPNFLLNDLMLMNQFPNFNKNESIMDDKIIKLQQNHLNSVALPSPPAEVIAATQAAVHPSITLPFSTDEQILQGVDSPTVFINDVSFEVGTGPFNVREAFGNDAVLVHPSGHPVLTNEWGDTLLPLQHGGSYYLLRPLLLT